jgi:hypothetical protein
MRCLKYNVEAVNVLESIEAMQGLVQGCRRYYTQTPLMVCSVLLPLLVATISLTR